MHLDEAQKIILAKECPEWYTLVCLYIGHPAPYKELLLEVMSIDELERLESLVTPPPFVSGILEKPFLGFHVGDHIEYVTASAVGGMVHYWRKCQ